jgi:hypothetical protein
VKNHFLTIAMLAFVLSACSAPATLTLEQTISPPAEIMSTNTPFPAIPTETPTLQVLESTPIQTSGNDTAELFSSDQLGLCFSYPQGYTHLPENDSVEIIGPELPTPDLRGLFWLEISDSYDRTTEVIADQEVTYAAGLNVGRWTVMLDGEQAVVLDGMPGQDFQRRVYVVHQQTLYVLAFMPTRSENKAAGDQMEALYTAITNSWSWSPCSASE